jgi:hypothetical protein
MQLNPQLESAWFQPCTFMKRISLSQAFAFRRSVCRYTPGQCEKNETRATAINVPSALIAALSSVLDQAGFRDDVRAGLGLRDWDARADPLLVHLSTDQVYGGADAMSTVDSLTLGDMEVCPVDGNPVAPINAYGRSKVAAEAGTGGGMAFPFRCESLSFMNYLLDVFPSGLAHVGRSGGVSHGD